MMVRVMRSIKNNWKFAKVVCSPTAINVAKIEDNVFFSGTSFRTFFYISYRKLNLSLRISCMLVNLLEKIAYVFIDNKR